MQQLSPKHSYRDTALVLRTQQLGDSDKIVILLSEQYGLIHAVAKGARKSKSKFGGRLEPFMLLEIGFVYKENLSLLNQTVTRQAYTLPLMQLYDAYLLANLLSELTEKFAKFGEYDSYYFRLLHGAISALSKERYLSLDIANAFMVRILEFSGWGFQISSLKNQKDFSQFQVEQAHRYCEALLHSSWDIITEEDFGSLPLAIFSQLTTHIQNVLDLTLNSLSLLQKELFSGR